MVSLRNAVDWRVFKLILPQLKMINIVRLKL